MRPNVGSWFARVRETLDRYPKVGLFDGYGHWGQAGFL